MLKMEEIPDAIDVSKIDVLLTIGAGDIDKLADPIEEKLKNSTGK